MTRKKLTRLTREITYSDEWKEWAARTQKYSLYDYEYHLDMKLLIGNHAICDVCGGDYILVGEDSYADWYINRFKLAYRKDQERYVQWPARK